jgi:hypothetical protein
MTKTNFFALGKEHKFDIKGKLIAGNIGRGKALLATLA